ncbi:GGDEF domain-containing protein [Desulfotomaculum nigrificans]|uniref:GGDEF domain-containing protein n=1 Tax=Desulfotomaculum nigrificans TaxID=1565 RepID=UPI0001FAE55E|nr:GGDEF domain-containing protein [Desulfotomaculum nigrificans]MDA8235927.1 GGDEF domain-containing protein [Clostridia bacterium]
MKDKEKTKEQLINELIEGRQQIRMLKELNKKLHSLSMVDELTGLYNRRGFLTLTSQRLEIASGATMAMYLLFADLDNLKWVNDNLGHREGDRAIIETGNILKKTFRNSDIIARLGGDEFVVLLQGADNSSERITRRLQEYMEEYNAKGNRPYKLEISVGIVRCEMEYSIEELLARADDLMYRHKRSKRIL